jgi:hypothetical protein
MGEQALRLLKGRSVEPARHRAAALAASDQADALEHIKMLENRRQRHGKRLRQRADGEFRRFA